MRRIRRPSLANPRIRAAIDELQSMIRRRWPEARFKVSLGEDPIGVYLDVELDLEDLDEVMDLVIDRLVNLQVEEGIPVHVIPLQPLSRTLETLRRRSPMSLVPDQGDEAVATQVSTREG